MKQVIIYTSDSFLGKKIALELSSDFSVTISRNSEPFDGDIIIWDIDTMGSPCGKTDITLSRTEECAVQIPYMLGDIIKRLNCCESDSGILRLKEERAILLRGKKIKLTELEYSLFSALYERGGDYVSRGELKLTVFGEETNDRMLNLYIHYLRDKLEADGERVIFSSRNHGYKISEKFISEKNI